MWKSQSWLWRLKLSHLILRFSVTFLFGWHFSCTFFLRCFIPFNIRDSTQLSILEDENKKVCSWQGVTTSVFFWIQKHVFVGFYNLYFYWVTKNIKSVFLARGWHWQCHTGYRPISVNWMVGIDRRASPISDRFNASSNTSTLACSVCPVIAQTWIYTQTPDHQI